MVEVKFDKPNYVALLHQLATTLKAPVKDNAFNIPLGQGTGWIWAEEISSNITILVSDTKLNKDFSFSRKPTGDSFFSLQFNEVYTDDNSTPAVVPINNSIDVIQAQSFVMLFNTSNPATYIIPANTRVKSVKFYFNKSSLSNIIDSYSLEKLFTQYLPKSLEKERPELIDVVYRPILDELLEVKPNHPLRINFIKNRVLLLLEKFIYKQMHAKVIPLKSKLDESEVERLMQAESLLVKDYGTAPPTISKLSRICAMSATKLKNDFKSLYGVPIYEYFQKNRMAKAKSLLMEGSYTSKEVGMKIGYSNLSHFAAAFKKEFGILPSDLLAKDGALMYAI